MFRRSFWDDLVWQRGWVPDEEDDTPDHIVQIRYRIKDITGRAILEASIAARHADELIFKLGNRYGFAILEDIR